MTCIVGLERDGKVYMGGDSAAANGWNIRETMLPKVFIRAGMIIGYTTSFRMGQLLEFGEGIPIPEVHYDPLAFMVTRFIPAIRECFKSNGFTKIENNEETGGDFLAGIGGKLFHVSSDFQVNRYADGYAAVGCGEQYAVGALRILERIHNDPYQIIRESLEVAEHFSNGVKSPFYVHYL